MAGVKEGLTTCLLERRWLSEDTFEADLERPPGFRFSPGQGIMLSRDGIEREYSLISGPEEARLSVCIQVVQKGLFSPLLASLPTGSSLSLTGPHGYFTLQPGNRPPVLVATGTGIAPFVSMVHAGARSFTMLHGAAGPRALYYRSIVQPAAAEYVGCLSRETSVEPHPLWEYPGRVTDFLEDRLPAGAFDFYLCGRREMVRDVMRLVDDRFAGSRVFFEIFF